MEENEIPRELQSQFIPLFSTIIILEALSPNRCNLLNKRSAAIATALLTCNMFPFFLFSSSRVTFPCVILWLRPFILSIESKS